MSLEDPRRHYNTPVKTETYVRRTAARKFFKLRQDVFYDIDTEPKLGVIVKLGGSTITMANGDERNIHDIYPATEFSKRGHWDYLSNSDRYEVLKSVGLSETYIDSDFSGFTDSLKDLIVKVGDTGAVVQGASPTAAQGATLQAPGRSYKEPKSKAKKDVHVSPDPSEEAEPE